MEALNFYILLGIVTTLIGILSWAMWLRTNSLIFPLGSALLYFWTLYGAWWIVLDLDGGQSGMRYHYLLDLMFEIVLDSTYMYALFLYASFIITVQLAVLWVLRNHRFESNVFRMRPIEISHQKIILLTAAVGLLSYYLVHDQMEMAVRLGESGYRIIRGAGEFDVIPLFTLHKFLNRVALIPAVLGLSIFFSGPNPKYIGGRGCPQVLFGYSLVIGGMFWMCMHLGFKSELLFSLLAGATFYLANSAKPKTLLLAMFFIVALASISVIDSVRGLPVTQIAENLDFELLISSASVMGRSNEAFGAHLSMYGVLDNDVPLTYGSSFVALVCSVVPKIFWPDRPDVIYYHYADNVKAVEGIFCTIHHATGWYLNFGVAGSFLGAILLGWTWGKLFEMSSSPDPARKIWRLIFVIVSPYTFTASIPDLVRAGPEGYKGVLLMAFLIPVLILTIASRAECAPANRKAGQFGLGLESKFGFRS